MKSLKLPYNAKCLGLNRYLYMKKRKPRKFTSIKEYFEEKANLFKIKQLY